MDSSDSPLAQPLPTSWQSTWQPTHLPAYFFKHWWESNSRHSVRQTGAPRDWASRGLAECIRVSRLSLSFKISGDKRIAASPYQRLAAIFLQPLVRVSLQKYPWTSLHSSRMCTARLLPVSPSMHCTGGCLPLGGVCSRGVSAHGGCWILGSTNPVELHWMCCTGFEWNKHICTYVHWRIYSSRYLDTLLYM